jgi:hypothetical protein
MLLQRRQLGAEVSRECGSDGPQLAGDLVGEHVLEREAQRIVVLVHELAQERRALREQRRQQRDRASRIVVEVAQEPAPRGIVGRRRGQRRAHRRFIERLGVVDEPRLRPQSRGERRLPRNACAERIDRLYGEPRWMVRELPAGSRVLFERGKRELARSRLVRRVDRSPRLSCGQRTDDPLAHLARGLAGERHRDDPLGPVDAGEQREEALDQELGLPRACGRLDEERPADVEHALAGGRVGILEEINRRRHRRCRRARRRAAPRRRSGRRAAGRSACT